MLYSFVVKNCGVCPFLKSEKMTNYLNHFCWLNDENVNISFNFEQLPQDCPLLNYTNVNISCEED